MSNPTTLPDFNPTADPRVTSIKTKTQELMDLVQKFEGDGRCKSIAVTNYEQAAMWAVKSLFVE